MAIGRDSRNSRACPTGERKEKCAQGNLLAEAERVESEVARGTLALEGLEESEGAENLSEGNPQENLAHAALIADKLVT